MDRKRSPRRNSALTACFCILFLGLISADTIRAGGLPESASNAVRSSDLVIIGRVIGLVDQKPAAMQRKSRERHWVDVMKTLKGHDESGDRFAVLPQGPAWQDGKDYILFLEWGGSKFAKARYLPALPATATNIAAVKREIAAQGAGPTPRRAYWVRHASGWQLAPAIEFIVTADSRFVWSRRRPGAAEGSRAEILRGILPKSALASLVRGAEGLPTAVAGDDEGKVTVHWRDASGKKQAKELGPTSGRAAKSVLQEIEALARRHQ